MVGFDATQYAAVVDALSEEKQKHSSTATVHAHATRLAQRHSDERRILQVSFRKFEEILPAKPTNDRLQGIWRKLWGLKTARWPKDSKTESELQPAFRTWCRVLSEHTSALLQNGSSWVGRGLESVTLVDAHKSNMSCCSEFPAYPDFQWMTASSLRKNKLWTFKQVAGAWELELSIGQDDMSDALYSPLGQVVQWAYQTGSEDETRRGHPYLAVITDGQYWRLVAVLLSETAFKSWAATPEYQKAMEWFTAHHQRKTSAPSSSSSASSSSSSSSASSSSSSPLDSTLHTILISERFCVESESENEVPDNLHFLVRLVDAYRAIAFSLEAASEKIPPESLKKAARRSKRLSVSQTPAKSAEGDRGVEDEGRWSKGTGRKRKRPGCTGKCEKGCTKAH
jgi:hypothetical protein